MTSFLYGRHALATARLMLSCGPDQTLSPSIVASAGSSHETAGLGASPARRPVDRPSLKSSKCPRCVVRSRKSCLAIEQGSAPRRISLSDAVFKGCPLTHCQVQSMLGSTIQHVSGVGRP